MEREIDGHPFLVVEGVFLESQIHDSDDSVAVFRARVV